MLARHAVAIRETFATVIAEEALVPLAEATVARLRADLERYISIHPHFRSALRPLPVAADAPPVVRRMADAAARAGVGPMAAVAGAIAALTVEAVHAAGATHVVVDNGGDVCLWIDRPVTVGIFAGPSPVRDVAFRVEPRGGPLGICTSSGTVGHSLSLGRADAAVVVAPDAALADAVATALGNAVKGEDTLATPEALDGLLVDGVEGMLAIAGRAVAAWGELPELVRAPLRLDRVARGEAAP